MKRLAFAILAFALLAPAAASGARMTVPRATIDAMGTSRLTEVVARVAPWFSSTTDFYNLSPTPGAAATPRAMSWSILLNGTPMDVGAFDAIHLELVPVSVGEIDSIVVVTAEDGTTGDSSRGRLEIYTTRVQSGWTVDAALSAANESGDPGPYAFTGPAAPNVDAIGPDAALRIARGSANWYASLSGRLAQHPFTDAEIRERTTSILNDYRPGVTEPPPSSDATSWFYDPTWPVVLRTSATLRAGIRAGNHWQDATFSISDARRWFHFSEAFGTEVPTDQRVTMGALRGRLGTGARSYIEYNVAASEKSLRDTDGILAFDYEWETRTEQAAAAWVHPRARATTRLGGSVEHRGVSSVDTLTTTDDTFVRAIAALDSRVARNLTIGASISATFLDDEHALSGGVSSRWVVRDADTLAARVAYRERLAAEDDDIWLWTARGWSMLAGRGLAPTYQNVGDKTGIGTVELAWSSSGMLGGIRLAGTLNRFDDATVQRRDYTFDPAACAFIAPSRVIGGQSGHTALLDLRVWHGLGANSRADFGFVYLEEFNSDADFSAVWQSVPRHQLRYGVSFWPRKTWSGRVGLTHISSTHWVDYDDVDGTICMSDGLAIPIHARVDGFTYLDASIRHGMFGGRWVADLIARNILDGDMRYHPAGANMNFTLLVQLRTDFGR